MTRTLKQAERRVVLAAMGFYKRYRLWDFAKHYAPGLMRACAALDKLTKGKRS